MSGRREQPLRAGATKENRDRADNLLPGQDRLHRGRKFCLFGVG